MAANWRPVRNGGSDEQDIVQFDRRRQYRRPLGRRRQSMTRRPAEISDRRDNNFCDNCRRIDADGACCDKRRTLDVCDRRAVRASVAIRIVSFSFGFRRTTHLLVAVRRHGKVGCAGSGCCLLAVNCNGFRTEIGASNGGADRHHSGQNKRQYAMPMLQESNTRSREELRQSALLWNSYQF